MDLSSEEVNPSATHQPLISFWSETPALGPNRSVSNFQGLSTAQVVLHVSASHKNEWRQWRKDVREVSRHFPGFRVMQILDLGQRDEVTRTVVVVAKFTSYHYLRNWTESIEWKDCLEKARKSGLVVDDDNSQGRVEILASDGEIIDLSGLRRPTAVHPKAAVESPPKYRIFAVIYLGAIPWLLLYIYVDILGKLTEWLGDHVFAIFIYLYIFVFFMVYSTTPLLLRLAFGKWVHMPRVQGWVRHKIPVLSSVWLQLENGVGLFQRTPPRPHAQLVSRLEREEGRVEALRETAFRSQDRVKRLEVALTQSVAATERLRRTVQLLAKATGGTAEAEDTVGDVLRSLAKAENEDSFAGGLNLEGSDSGGLDGQEPASYHFNWIASTTDLASTAYLSDGADAAESANGAVGQTTAYGSSHDTTGDDVEGVTMTAVHHVRWERTHEFEDVMRYLAETMYKYSGTDFMGLDVLTDKSSGKLEFISIFRFRTYAKMREWMMSDTRRRALCRLQPLLEETRGRESSYELLPATQARDSFDSMSDDGAHDKAAALGGSIGSSESKVAVDGSGRGLRRGAGSSKAKAEADGAGRGGKWNLRSICDRARGGISRPGVESQRSIRLSVNSGRVLRDVYGELLIPQIAGDEPTVSPAVPPPLWKTWFLTSLGLFLIFIVVAPRLGPVLEDAGLENSYGRGIVVLGVNIFGNVYFGAPLMTFIFGDWLHQYTAVEASRGIDPWRKWLFTGIHNPWWMVALNGSFALMLVFALATPA